METRKLDPPSRADPGERAGFHAGRFFVWLPLCLVHGGLVAYAAALAEPLSAPLLLFSLIVGAVLGITLAGGMRLVGVGNRPTVLVGVVLAASAAVSGQHYLGYRRARAEAAEEGRTHRLARLAFGDQALGQTPLPPSGFLPFLRWRAARGMDVLGFQARGALVWLLWAADGLLVLAAALAVVLPALNRPYCNRCRSWFGTTRLGPLDRATARRVGALVEAELPDEFASARYRVFACRGGCGWTGFELGWRDPGGARSSAKAWLDVERRNLVVRALDEGISHR